MSTPIPHLRCPHVPAQTGAAAEVAFLQDWAAATSWDNVITELLAEIRHKHC